MGLATVDRAINPEGGGRKKNGLVAGWERVSQDLAASSLHSDTPLVLRWRSAHRTRRTISARAPAF
jgi:hypothetical protein